jgi:hypothetical protein
MDFSANLKLCLGFILFSASSDTAAAFGSSSTARLSGAYSGRYIRWKPSPLLRKTSRSCTASICMSTPEVPIQRAKDCLTENFVRNPWANPPADVSGRVQVEVIMYSTNTFRSVLIFFFCWKISIFRKSLPTWRKILSI